MSWFGRGSQDEAPALPTPPAASSASIAASGPSPTAALIAENFRQYSDQLNTVTELCWEKCITKKSQADLAIGEIACNDRCVLKFLATATKVGEVFQQKMMEGQGVQPSQQAIQGVQQ